MRLIIFSVSAAVLALASAGPIATVSAQRASASDCVTIAVPKPTATFVYQHTEPGGRATRVSNTWDRFNETGSRLRAEGPAGVFVQVNAHHIENDVVVLDGTSKLGPSGNPIDSTTFKPGLIAEPAFHACAGQSWQIPPVTATFQSSQTNTSASTPAGTLKIVAVRERVTVPAGTFDTVHYVRTSQSTDEYWKSIEHGVIVKHTGTLPAGTASEILLEIR
ncbi:MAG TPA: hypothetical protein VH497_11710 [Vicinamibacterales bacterium]|jgi:hypothetical protein